MKAGGLIVLSSALMSTVSAQTTEPSENLAPRVLRTAEMIGVRSQVEELLQLRSAPKRDDIRELRLAQRLQGVVIASALDVESVNARIDYETALAGGPGLPIRSSRPKSGLAQLRQLIYRRWSGRSWQWAAIDFIGGACRQCC